MSHESTLWLCRRVVTSENTIMPWENYAKWGVTIFYACWFIALDHVGPWRLQHQADLLRRFLLVLDSFKKFKLELNYDLMSIKKKTKIHIHFATIKSFVTFFRFTILFCLTDDSTCRDKSFLVFVSLKNNAIKYSLLLLII